MAQTPSTSEQQQTWRQVRQSRADAAQRWQGGLRPSAEVLPEPRSPVRRRRTLRRLLISGMLFGLLLYWLLYFPARTPMLTILSLDATWPVPLSDWSAEDIADFAVLDGQNISLHDLTDVISRPNPADVLTAFDESLAEFAMENNGRDAVILYISAPGAVDENGIPCLITATSFPLAASSWIPVGDILDAVQRRFPARPKLVALNCTRQRTNWGLGVLHDTFAERIQIEVTKRAIPNLAVLNCASPAEISWTSPELNGSVFGQFLHLGLAGAADETTNEGKTSSGNGDGTVTLRELHSYLRREVSAWVAYNRAAIQRPMLIPNDAADFALVQSLNDRVQRRIENQRTIQEIASTESISEDDLTALWRQLDALRARRLYQLDPSRFARLERQLLSLESRLDGGIGYSRSATDLANRLKEELRGATARADNAAEVRSAISQWQIMNPDATYLPPGASVSSLALAEYCGLADGEAADVVRQQLTNLTDAGAALPTDVAELLPGTYREMIFTDFLRRYSPLDTGVYGGLLEKVVNVHALAEKSAVPFNQQYRPGDERAHSLLLPALADLDEQRRQEEDLLFGNVRNDASEWESRWDRLRDSYNALGKTREDIASGYEILDRMAAELPYIAEWAMNSDRATQLMDGVRTDDQLSTSAEETAPSATPTSSVTSRLIDILNDAEELASSLARLRQSDQADSLASLLLRSRALGEQFAALSATFSNAYGELLRVSRRDAETLREILSVLDTPLIPADQRRALRDKARSLGSRLHRDYFEMDTEAANQSERKRLAATIPTGRTTDTAFGDSHPLPALFQIGKTVDEEPATGEDQEAKLTSSSRWELLGGQVRASLSGFLEGMTEEELLADLDDGNRHRLGSALALADYHFRRQAPFMPTHPSLDFVQVRRRFDLQGLLLWHYRRELDDFLGTSDSYFDVSDEPYFSVAGRTLRQAAENVISPSNSVQANMDELDQMRLARLEAANQGIGLSAQASIIDNLARPQASLNANSGTLAGAFPAGKAAIQVWEQGRPLGELSVAGADEEIDTAAPEFIALPLEENAIEKRKIYLTGEFDRSVSHTAVVYYRGNRFSVPLFLPELRGVVIDYQPFEYGPPLVTLHGDRMQPASIMFVLDCSASMAQTVPTEDRSTGVVTKLDIAASALAGMLNQLSLDADASVGVTLFGHRVGWTTRLPTTVLRQEEYAKEIPADLPPARDAENVLTLGRFDTVEAGELFRLLETVRPWGQSPLYFAITESLQSFVGTSQRTENHVIVITDGDNYQYTPSNGSDRELSPVTIDSVLEAWQGTNAAVHVVWFDENGGESSERKREFQTLAERTGGSVTEARNSKQILDAIRQRLGKAVYYIENERGIVLNRDRTSDKTGTPLNIPAIVQPFSKNEIYEIRFREAATRLQLEGGEALKFQVSPDGTEILAAPYEDAAATVTPLVHTGNGPPTDYQFGVEPLVKTNGSVRLRAWIRSPSMDYTPRPEEAWLELVPIVDGRPLRSHTYRFFDANYAPNRPVPTLDWTAADWPENAESAHLYAWFKAEPTVPAEAIAVADVAASPSEYASDRPVPGMPEASYRVQISDEDNGDVALSVIQAHAQQTGEPQFFRVKLAAMEDVSPIQVIHRFDQEHALATHTFVFDGTHWEQLIGDAELEIQLTSRKESQVDAWSVPATAQLVLRIPRGGDLLFVP